MFVIVTNLQFDYCLLGNSFSTAEQSFPGLILFIALKTSAVFVAEQVFLLFQLATCPVFCSHLTYLTEIISEPVDSHPTLVSLHKLSSVSQSVYTVVKYSFSVVINNWHMYTCCKLTVVFLNFQNMTFCIINSLFLHLSITDK